MNEWVSLALGIWLCIFLLVAVYGSVPISVLNKEQWDAIPDSIDFKQALIAGAVPGVNILFLVGGFLILRKIGQLSKEYEGVEDDRQNFNDFIRTLCQDEE